MKDRQIRSPLTQARSLGSTKNGAVHWWAQRVTAVALVPLMIWFLGSLIALTGADYTALLVWLRFPLNTVLLVAFVIALFYHMALGLQVVVEDYVHIDRIKIPVVMVIYIGCVFLAITGIVSIIRMIA